ncbi:NfeD family protein [Candidatus Dependentiae bacterium]|nr:NfeD family protein [Candidatus Dependentiae bacterium]
MNIILQLSYVGFIWLIIALLFLLAELTTPGLFLFIAFALGSVVASIFAFLDFSFILQCLTFLLGFAVSFFILRFLVKSRDKRKILTNVYALKGKSANVIKKIDKNGKGLVKVGGEVWTAQGFDGLSFEENEVVKVVSIKGSRLIVK